MNNSKARAWMERVVIPTYEAAKPDKNPLFLEKRVYQGSSGKVYPHPVIDKISDVKKNREYTALFLENDYLKIMILPELGAEKDATIGYVKDMVKYFKAYDKRRFVNYVSNTLSRVENAEKDDATLYGDIAMWNDYLGLWEPSDDIENNMIRTCKKAEGMPLLVSEFGLCEPHFKGGDKERARILKERLKMYEKISNICGYMWFSLNDYRTHCGEEGEDKLRRRVHGSTDLYANEKPSYRLLCDLQK